MIAPFRIGIDLGGTKIAITALGADGHEAAHSRMATPREDYDATIAAIGHLIGAAENTLGSSGICSIGIAMPGSISPASGLVQNANSTWLNGRPFRQDLEAYLRRPVRLANDANCFALSEAADGAGAGANSVFGVILGTGCGGGLVYRGRAIDGPRGIGGEWGHTPLPWATADDQPAPSCWCGLESCMESWVSGPALHRDYLAHGGNAEMSADAAGLAALALKGDAVARGALDRHAARLARGLAAVVNIFDPGTIVLGGGLSKMLHLYETLPPLMAPFIFADQRSVAIYPPVHGDASGARGAARLWDCP